MSRKKLIENDEVFEENTEEVIPTQNEEDIQDISLSLNKKKFRIETNEYK